MIIALTGGVGGAKLIMGLAAILPPEELTIVVNTGDDFNYWGLSISPDLDSVMYKLAGINNTETGWGIMNETWHAFQAMKNIGADHWFQIGDQDLATHLERSRLLRAGKTLSEATQHLCQRLNLKHNLVPMSNEVVKTCIHTETERLDFQDYFVKYQSQPVIKSITYEGAAFAKPSPRFLQALMDPKLTGIIICPSNPLLSIAPILALPEIKTSILKRKVPIIAISPLKRGQAFKGPTAKIMNELGLDASVLGIGTYYQSFLTTLIIDPADNTYYDVLMSLGLSVVIKNIVLKTRDDCLFLAHEALKLTKNH